MLAEHAAQPRVQPEPADSQVPSFTGDWVFLNPERDEALARLWYLVEHRRPHGVLWGPPETGKTTLLQYLQSRLQRTQRAAVGVDLRGLGGPELLWQLAAAFQLDPRDEQPPQVLWRRVRDHVEGLRLSGIQTVLLIDHVDRARDDCLPVLHRLADGMTGPEPWMTVLLSARTERTSRTAGPLRDFAGLRIEIGSFDISETAAYVREFLQRSGRTADFFTEEAQQALFEMTGGCAGAINRMLELSLLAAEADRRSVVDAELVHQAALERAQPAARR